MADSTPSDVQAAISIAKRAYEPKILMLEYGGISAPVILSLDHAGAAQVTSVKDCIDEYRINPERRTGTIKVDDLGSFIEAVNRDKNEDSVIFAVRDRDKPRLVAILNFHHAGGDKPQFCDDRIRYAFPLSDEWRAWNGMNGQTFDQGRFTAFIEDHLFDVGTPADAGAITQAFAAKLKVDLAGPQALLEVSRGLSIRSTEVLKTTVNLQTGATEFAFKETHEDGSGAPLKVPGAFHILIPLFKGGALYSIPVRLRYRKQGPNVVWFYEMHRADLFMDAAINDVIERVRRPEDSTEAAQVAAPSDADATRPAPLAQPIAAGGCGLTVFLGFPPSGRSTDDC